MTKIKTSILAMIIAIAAIGLLTSTISFSNSADAQQETIPEWIQNIALFWGQGDISESEFVNALEFLGDEGILRLPAAESAEAQEITASIEDLEKRLEKIEGTPVTRTGQTSSPGTITSPPPPPSSICPQDGTVQHWDKIIFKITQDKSQLLPTEYLDANLDLKIIDPPGKVVNLEKEIFDHLTKQLEIRGTQLSDLEIDILDVRYETVTCGITGPQGPAGPKGGDGDQGPPGQQEIVITTKSAKFEPAPSSFDSYSSPSCDDDEVLVGGGFLGAGNGVYSSIGSQTGKTWDVRPLPDPTPDTLIVNAFCAKLIP